MKIFLIGLIFFLSFTSIENSYQILWCSEIGEARKDLENRLNKPGVFANHILLNQLFENWQKKNRLHNPIAVVRIGSHTFKWPSPGNKKALFFNNRAGVLGTRSVSIPSLEEIQCFFQDTLVLVDTLRFFTGLPLSSRFFLKTALGEFEIPFDKIRGELLIAVPATPIVTAGGYQAATIYLQKDEKRQQLATTILYLLTSNEKRSLKAALLNRRSEVYDCDLFINESTIFLQNFWGGKSCRRSGQYDYAQEEMLRRLTNCIQ